MSENYKNDIIIQGITAQGKIFRPSDWSERLSGILSSFDQDHRLAYHSYVRPLLINQVRCVVIDKQLEQLNAPMFRFLMDFAQDNQLRVCEGTQAGSIALPAKPSGKTEKQPYQIIEISAENTAQAYPAMVALRTHISSQEDFVRQVNDILRPTGYRLVGVFESGRHQALAVCGYRISHSLAWGRYFDLKDLSTLPEYRDPQLAQQLLDYLHAEAVREGNLPIHFDSSVNADRQETHRLFFNAGYRISSYHFMRDR